MKQQMKLLVSFCVSFFLFSPFLFSSCFNQPGVCFSGKGARFVLMDVSSRVNLRNNANKGWEEFSIVKNCVEGLAAGLRSYDDAPCDLMVNNSRAIENLTDCCTQISSQVYANSEAIVLDHELTVDNSNAINYWADIALYNSMAIVANSLDLIFQNSLAINANRYEINANSQSIVNNSNAIIANKQAIINNSDAIVDLQNDINTLLAYSVRLDHIETLTQYIIDNSNAIANLNDCCIQISEQVYANSDAIVLDHELTVDNSNAIKFYGPIVLQNSLAITANSLGVISQNSLLIAQNQADIDLLYQYFSTIDHGPSDISFDTNQTMSYNIYLGPEHTMSILDNMILNGGSWYIHFSRADNPIFFVDPGKTVTLQNVVLKDFSPDYVSFGDASSKLVFGEGTTLELAENITLATELTFTGDCTIKGFDKEINFAAGGRLDVYDGSTLRLEDVELCGVGYAEDNLRCRTNDGSIVLQNCKLGIANNYSFSYGSMLFKEDVRITGTSTFEYSTMMGSTIDVCSCLLVDFGSTFKYAPPIANRDLLIMTNTSSKLHLNGCTLHSTTTGLRLTKGMVLFDNFVTLSADGQVVSEAISFGKTDDPSGTNDAIVGVLGGAYVEAYGYIDMK